MISPHRILSQLTCLFLTILFLSACGGGGGGGNPGNNKPSVPLTMNLGTPATEPSVIPPSAGNTQITVLAMVTGSAPPPASLDLDELDGNGQVLQSGVTQLHDDGKLADLKRGDRIFTGTINVGSVNAAEKRYRVSTTFNGKTLTSNTMNFWVSGCPATSRPSDPAQAVYDQTSGSYIFANEVMLRTKANVPPDLDSINTIASNANGHVVGCIPTFHQYLIEFNNPTADAAGVHNAIDILIQQSGVETAFPNAQSLADPVSPLNTSLLCNGTDKISCQWYLDQIRAPQAWALAGGGDPQMAVAMIDFGVDCTLNGLPCDGALNNQDPIDHGTGVAGVLASPNNSTGMVGAAFNTQLYPYNFLGKSGSLYKMSELINKALSQTDVRVINISAGTGADFDNQIKTAVCHAIGSGRLVVAAAGNPVSPDGKTCQLNNIFPASYNSANQSCDNGADLQNGLLVVGATDISNQLASWTEGTQNLCSNQSYVNLYAPGKDIITLSTQSGYTTKSGTSYAAPLVSAAAAVLWSVHPGDTPKQIHDQLISSASILQLKSLSSTAPTREQTADDRMIGKPLLDMYRAVGGVDSIVNPDTTPDAFTINAIIDADLQSDITSDPISVQGIDSPTPIHVIGGYYSINGGPFTNANGSVQQYDQVRVQVHSASDFTTTVVATLSIGDATPQDFSVTTRAADNTPGNFAFASQSNITPGNSVISNEQTINGIDTATTTPISISADRSDASAQYAIRPVGSSTFNPFTGGDGSIGAINNGDSVEIQVNAPADLASSVTVTLTIGTIQRTFVVSTPLPDTTPDDFSFTPVAGVDPGSLQTAGPVTVGGINTVTLMSISGGAYATVPAGSSGPPSASSYTSVIGNVNSGDQVWVQVNASTQSQGTASATLTIGNVTRAFNVTTKTLDITPDPFSFTPKTVLTGATATSDTVTITGINTPTDISISGDPTAQYAIGNNGATGTNFISGTSKISAQQTVTIQVTAPSVDAAAVNVTLTIGTVSEVFTVTTTGAITTPTSLAFNPPSIKDVDPGSLQTASVAINGINTASPFTLSGDPSAQYSLDSGATYTNSKTGTVTDGQTITVQLTASANPSSTSSVTLSMGTLSTTFSVTTKPAYTVTVNLLGDTTGGTVSPSTSFDVIQGNFANLGVTAFSGYNASVDNGCGGTPVNNLTGTFNYKTAAISASCTINVTFTKNTYHVTVNTGGSTYGAVTSQNPLPVIFNDPASISLSLNTGFSAFIAQSDCPNTQVSGATITTDPIQADCTITVSFKDTMAPVISITGNPITITQGTTYADQGVTVTDNLDTNVALVTLSTNVDTSTPGTYTVDYSATDAANNTAATVTRTVIVAAQNAFITKWQVDNPSSSPVNQITIGADTSNYTYDYTVDWGDNKIQTGLTGSVTHTYTSTNTYTVKITGLYPHFNAFDTNRLVSVEQWGDMKWQSMNHAFSGCSNMVLNALDKPDLSQVTDMSYMFSGASAFNTDISGWDVKTVTNMSNMFNGASSFDQNLNGWNVSFVLDMSSMFMNAKAFGTINGAIDLWDVHSVTTMRDMFFNSANFDSDIKNWIVSAVTDMNGMFLGAAAFNRNIGGWDVSSVTDMASMFQSATSFDGDIGGWGSKVALVKDMNNMFAYASSFTQNLTNWDVSSVTDMHSMFYRASKFNGDVGSWGAKVAAVQDMNSMFFEDPVFNQALYSWNVSSVKNMTYMFRGASAFDGIMCDPTMGGWNVSSVNTMYGMFFGAIAFNKDLSCWAGTTKSVSNMANMFYSATLFNGDVSTWDVSSVTDMDYMFAGASNFNRDLSNWATKLTSVTNMSGMFNGATNFNGNVSNWNVSSVKNMGSMFAGATAFDQDLSGWDISLVTNMAGMFTGATLSVANYDALLNHWYSLATAQPPTLPTPITFDGGNSLYSINSATARDYLSQTYGWIISDGGSAFVVSGHVVGLAAGTIVTLQDNGTDTLQITGDGTNNQAFSFATPVSNFDVTSSIEITQNQICGVNNGVGGPLTANVTDVTVTCISIIRNKIASGNGHTLEIRPDGSLWAWGYNYNGQLGNGNSGDVTTGVNRNVTSPQQIGTDLDWASVAAGASHTIALKTNGTLWAWGYNAYGQLGDQTYVNEAVPVQIKIGDDTHWASIAAGDNHSMALRTDGTLWAWGSNGYAELGDGTYNGSNKPIQIGIATNWSNISAGTLYSMAVRLDGTLWAWGWNNGQLGDGNVAGTPFAVMTPEQIGTSNKWVSVKIASGDAHSFGLQNDNSLWSWGQNEFGQLCNGTSGNGTSFAIQPNPTQVGLDLNWSSVVAGTNDTVAMKTDGSLWGCGENRGQFGITVDPATTPYVVAPTPISSPVSLNNVSLEGGFVYSALQSDGTIWNWGGNNWGQVGDGSTTDQWLPEQIDTATGFLYHSIGITVTGLLAGNTVTLQNVNSVDVTPDNVTIGGNGKFVFPRGFVDGTTYDVTVITQPVTTPQTCTVSNGTGALSGANVVDIISVSCL